MTMLSVMVATASPLIPQNAVSLLLGRTWTMNDFFAVCGICKAGTLIPQFQQRAPSTPKNQAGSRMASTRGRGESLSVIMIVIILTLLDSPSVIVPVDLSPCPKSHPLATSTGNEDELPQLIKRLELVDLTNELSD